MARMVDSNRRDASDAAEPQSTMRNSANGALGAEQIARLAYTYWEARGYRDGSPEQDWLRAEEEVKCAQTETAP
jgi:hypothetical protein